jgi:arylformamidase
MSIIDISRPLAAGMAVWPGDTPFSLSRSMELAAGDPVNLTTITMSAHTGSHVDAPLHFVDGGPAVDSLNLEVYWGATRVVTVKKNNGPLTPDDFGDYDLGYVRRLLVRSPASEIMHDIFPDTFVYPSPVLADYLGNQGIILYGTDGPSMDAEDSKSLEGHHALLRNNIAILEWLDLSEVEDGLYELVALPLKIVGGDGSPVRAVLRTI